jgi:hypothetical protein
VRQLSQLEELGERRRRLVAESQSLRARMAGEWGNLQTAAAWVESGYSLFGLLRCYWPLLTVAAGFLFARKRRPRFGFLGKIWSAWRLARKLVHLWRLWSPGSPGRDEGV